jgi:phage baseplate assembly protein W
MPFEVKRINPIDLEPSKAVGIKLPFAGDAIFNLNYTTKDAIKTNLTNFFLTGTGERFLNPTLGSQFQRLLFSQITEGLSERLRSTTIEELSIFFPQIRVEDIQINVMPDSNMIQFYLKYDIIDTNLDDTLIINLENPGFTELI